MGSVTFWYIAALSRTFVFQRGGIVAAAVTAITFLAVAALRLLVLHRAWRATLFADTDFAPSAIFIFFARGEILLTITIVATKNDTRLALA